MENKQSIKEPCDAPKLERIELSQYDVIITGPVTDLSENEISGYIGLEELW